MTVDKRVFGGSIVVSATSRCVMRPMLFVCIAAVFLVGCDSGTVADEEFTGTGSVAVVTAETPAGFVDFFTGSQVRSEFQLTGTFVPSQDKNFAMVRVPESLVALAESSQQPVTVSICNPSYGMVLAINLVGSHYHALSGVTNCTPWVETVDGRRTMTLTSGMAGLRGRVQIGWSGTDGAFVVLAVSGRLESACEGDGQSDAAMLIGTLSSDETTEDPMLDECSVAQGD